ncbi:MAG: replication factor C small subunit [Candidatus Nanohaloarchaeota archaeon QJJ-9]|nr:replication factor C small subunit [Candidatus Nanohaloarchaeota archaeon QJJ-9]
MIDVWTEKYRPDTLDEVIGHKNITERLKAFVKKERVPHMMFAGPAGTGKTTSAIALAKDLYGEEWKQNFMETNASDDRGIGVVRNQIKDFARSKPINADFKIIFLDESDALTNDAQQALRRTMEKYSESCRFILSCNYSSKIIPPIQSRCAIFRFNRLEDDEVGKYLDNLAEGEGLEVTETGMDALKRVSSGDLRKATNVLQAASIQGGEIDEEKVFEVAASLRPEEVKEVLDKALEGDFIEARKELSDLMVNRGLDGLDVIKAINREIYNLDISEQKKLEVIEQMGEYEFRIVEGGSPDLQIESLLAQISSLKD